VRRTFKVLLGLVVLGGLINVVSQQSPRPSSPATGDLAAATPNEVVRRKISIEKWSWSKDGFANVMVADFLFRNDNPFPVKDLTVKCVHSAPSGTKIDENTRTIYEIIPAHGTKRVQNFNMGFIATQAVQSSCGIVDFQLP
jgi:hypothetical protein